MKTAAKVIAINKDKVTLQMPSGGGCSAAQMFKTKPHTFKLKVPAGLSPKIGSVAVLNIDHNRSILSSFITFIIPLFGFPILYLLAEKITGSQAISALSGLGGIAIGTVIAFLINRKFNSYFLPEIVAFTNNKLPEVCQNCDIAKSCSTN